MRTQFCLATLLTLLAFVMTGCTSLPAPDNQVLSHSVDRQISSEAPSGKSYRVNTSQSQLRILVYPDGRLGHNHVIGGAVIHGDVVVPDNVHKTWLKLSIPVADMQLDKPEWRKAEGLPATLSTQAIAGTREHMLSDKVLDATKYPQIQIAATSLTGPSWQPDIQAQITIAGVSRAVTIPVSVQLSPNKLAVTGHFKIKQTDFGITPYCALGGILKIADTLTIRFHILAYPDQTTQ